MSVLRLPAFIVAVLFMFYSEALAALIHKVQIFNFKGKRNDMYEWADTCRRFFGVRVLRVGRTSLHREDAVMYLCNHRSWADFFMDAYLTEGRGMFLSRRAVALVFPCFIASASSLGGILLFDRRSIRDKKAFNARVDTALTAKGNCRGLLVYPEGHRSTAPQSLPLKRGMLYYSHGRGMPVQIIISTNKEAVLSEKATACGFGKVMKVGFSDVLRPEEFPDFEAFSAAVSKVWAEKWEEVYGADPSNLPLHSPDNMELLDLPLHIRLQQLVVSIVSIIVMFVAAASTVWSARTTMESMGDVGKLLAAVVIIVTAASFAQAYSGPVHAPLLVAANGDAGNSDVKKEK